MKKPYVGAEEKKDLFPSISGAHFQARSLILFLRIKAYYQKQTNKQKITPKTKTTHLPCRTAEACKEPQIPALFNSLNLLLSGIHANKKDD